MGKNSIFSARDIVLAGLFAAATAVLSQISIPIPISPVPFSLGLFGVMLTANVLETKVAVMSQLVYVLVGATGVPVFAGFQGGIQRLAGPTGGFLIGYILMALAIGLILQRKPEAGFPRFFLANIAGLVVLHTLGSLWLGFSANMSFYQTIMADIVPFFPLDLVKAGICAVVARQLRQRLLAT